MFVGLLSFQLQYTKLLKLLYNILFFHYFLENSLGVFLFLCKNVTNFGYPSLKLNNPTDHNQGPGKWVGRVVICPPNIQTNSIDINNGTKKV